MPPEIETDDDCPACARTAARAPLPDFPRWIWLVTGIAWACLAAVAVVADRYDLTTAGQWVIGAVTGPAIYTVLWTQKKAGMVAGAAALINFQRVHNEEHTAQTSPRLMVFGGSAPARSTTADTRPIKMVN